MRDPARIPRILELLRQRWEEHPQQRLGQLIGNFAGRIPHAYKSGVYLPEDPRLLEDDLLEASLARGWEQFTARKSPSEGK